MRILFPTQFEFVLSGGISGDNTESIICAIKNNGKVNEGTVIYFKNASKRPV